MAFHGPSETCPLQHSKVASYSTAWGRNKISSSGAELPGHLHRFSRQFYLKVLHKIKSNCIALEGLEDSDGPDSVPCHGSLLSYWIKTSVIVQRVRSHLMLIKK